MEDRTENVSAQGEQVEAALYATGDPYLDAYQGERPLRGRHVVARRVGRCTICGGTIRAGSSYIWSEQHRRGACDRCGCPSERRVRP